VQTTLVDPAGRSEINDFDLGDVWYFPRRFPHSLACLGDKACHFILIFDTGYFSEFGTFSITDWLGQASKELLAKNFGVLAATFEGFPREEAYFVNGPVPPETALPLQGALMQPPQTHR
jgi:oxalate decarboxylase